ncbi:MAG TPA: hypothetical protein VFY93_04635 [Planctomycetota bacterium]|nr:hypothetical protein [Planctomycetota bacterium]
MRGSVVLAAFLLAGAASAQDAPREFQVRPLGFNVTVPAGWKGEQAASGLVAQDEKRNGFIVTREPFLHDPDTFAAAWRVQLSAAKIDAIVEKTKAAARDAWFATWTAGDRRIEVWRVYAPENEMIYNFSFSGAKDFDLKSLEDATLKSFKCTAPKPELKFQQKGEAVTTRISLRLPEGYEKEKEAVEGFRLGGGIMGGFVKTLPGYDPPHVAGRIRFQQHDAGITYGTRSGDIPGGATDKWLERAWAGDESEFGQVAKKPRARSATYSGIKGDWMEATVIAKSGLPQRWMGFVGKYKQDVITLIVIVDEREARLHKDYLKQVCANFEIAK